MAKLWNIIQRISYAVAAFCMFAVILLIFINVLCRYVFSFSISWSEEMTRYMFIGTLFFTLNIMVSQNAALRVDILDNFIHNQRSKHILNLITYVLTVVALLVFTLSGVMLVQAGLTSVSPSMHIPMWIIYAMMPLGYFLALIEVLRKIAAEIRAIRVLR
ncbi:MAG: TRAP transporter small permease subunit [Oscillibacter sp.]|nr:TRAP transporter small permease subunit [Oscillibacter sp.]